MLPPIPKEVLVWLLFTFVVSVLPLGIDCLVRLFNQQAWFDYQHYRDGQLLIIAVSFGAESIGNILIRSKLNQWYEILIIGSCFLTTLAAGILYPYIKNLPVTSQKTTSQNVDRSIFYATVAIFLFSFATSLFCKYLSMS
ncbi:hypothetical protein VF14_12810 [Nostoc linckia z18]|jgi:hypothetical protein|uniref:Uncharacterized protein n=2 Tax=Nostoc linckia TaxID=92942 RepID=A0A9Q5Z9V2_NOSLI|nr:hypothetical protein [Nostoc linckia]PHK10324.1 hypothetical protein VF09_11545 [Nostoc linckia z9]PHK40407.1 hypothetical protein VF12_10780 [Nostoc linckia z15]PHK48331.1 hypothetical protein VF13_01125 [Nostoc linckia z16]PHJ62863.1 hypothetical protein VF05_26035 [Nostoc linckia z3]PHJ66779.1 hypothetical protein VF02_07535 [Nostoc linckia z1]